MVLTPAEGASVRLFDDRRESFVAVAQCGCSTQEPAEETLPHDDALIGWVVKHAQPALVEDTHVDERFVRRPEHAREARSVICAPLYSRGEVLGVLEGWHSETGAFLPLHVDYLQLLANCGTPSIELARLERIALTDPLTAVFNRGYLDQRLGDEIRRAQRFGRALSIAMIDLDRLEPLKQRLGEVIPNGILREVATRIRKQLRAHDVVARYRDDTFLVLMPETGTEAASAVANRLLRAIASLAAEVLPPEVPPDSCTASVGLGVLLPADDARALVGRASDALGNAKRRGGNCCDGPV